MMRKLRMALLVAAASVALGVGAQAKSVTLVHQFKVGQIDKYKMAMDMRLVMPGMPRIGDKPINMKMTSTFRQKVLGILPDGSAKVLLTYGDVRMSCPQFPNMPRQMKPTSSMTAVISKDGRVLSVDGMGLEQMYPGLPGFDPSALAGQIGYMGVFPTEPIEVGQSWANDVPLPFNSGTVNIVSTLLAAAVPVGKTTACKIKQDFQAYMDLGAMMKSIAASSNIQMGDYKPNGGMQMTGWSVLYFTPDSCRLLKVQGKAQADFSMDMPALAVNQGAPPTITMNMMMNINITRI